MVFYSQFVPTFGILSAADDINLRKWYRRGIHLMNCGSTDGCTEDYEFFNIGLIFDCSTLSLKMTW